MSCDCEIPKFFDSYEPVARKDHVCSECRGTIKKGEKYHRVTGLWDDFASFKICPECWELRGDMEKEVEPDCIAFGCLREDIAEWTCSYVARGEKNPYVDRMKEIIEKRGGLEWRETNW